MKRLVGMALLALSAAGVNAGTQAWYAEVEAVLVDDVAYGGCMIALKPTPVTATGGVCTTNWVSLNCKALDPTDFGFDAAAAGYTVPTKSDGANKLAAAQLALVTGTQLYVVVNDAVRFNSRCVATRLQNTTTANP